MRLLLQRHDRESFRTSFKERAAHRRTNPNRDEWTSLPVRNVPANPEGDSEGRPIHEGRRTMSTRRDFLKTSGALIVGFSLGEAVRGQARGAQPGPDARQVDTW